MIGNGLMTPRAKQEWIERLKECCFCRGSGKRDYEHCYPCNGKGKIEPKCSRCQGSGRTWQGKCSTCSGTGKFLYDINQREE